QLDPILAGAERGLPHVLQRRSDPEAAEFREQAQIEVAMRLAASNQLQRRSGNEVFTDGLADRGAELPQRNRALDQGNASLILSAEAGSGDSPGRPHL